MIVRIYRLRWSIVRENSQPNVPAFGCIYRTFERGVYAIGDEIKGRASLHDDRCSGMPREHKYGRMVRRIVTPPASPVVVRPGSPDGSEHVAAHEPRPNIGEAPGRKTVVDSGDTTLAPMHLLKRPRRAHPFIQREAAF